LFTDSWFNSALSTPHVNSISKWWTGNDMEVVLPDTKENHEKPQWGRLFSRSRIEPKTSLSSFLLSIQFQHTIIIHNGNWTSFQIRGYNTHGIMALFSCGSFNDTVSSSDYTASNDRMTKE
jgi:hypothetical protein